MMDYTEFKNEILGNIKDYLSDEYKDFNLEFQTITKSEYEYEALLISPERRGSVGIPALNITEAYEQYQQGLDFSEVIQHLADIRMNARLEADINPHDILDFEKIKDRIQPRIINAENNAKYLSDKPYTTLEDLAIIYVVRFVHDHSCSDAIITTTILDTWGIDVTTLKQTAINNVCNQKPYISNLLSVLAGDKESLSIDDLNVTDCLFPFFILTNQVNSFGAAELLNSDLMESIVERLGDVYIIPSSIHEVLIVPKSKVSDVYELKATIKTVNASDALNPEDVLSEHVYEYYSETRSIAIVA